jgi:hypothetical protein
MGDINKKSFNLNVCFVVIAIIFFAWISSGSLSPYASTSHEAIIIDNCGYIGSVDHDHFHKTYLFLSENDNDSAWQGSFILRRILYPILAFPLMSLFGFLVGGFITNLILILGSLFVLIRFFKDRISHQALTVLIWLFALYPGIYYYIGLPYSYNMLVPICVLCSILLRRTYEASRPRAVLINSLLIGLLFTGYELLPFFGLAQLWLVFRKRQYWGIPINLFLIMLPAALVSFILSVGFGHEVLNSNTGVFGSILKAWLGIFSMEQNALSQWLKFLRGIPWYFIDNFFTSTFIYLSLGFLFLWLINKKTKMLKGYFTDVQVGVFAGALILFLFNNLAPPYDGWQMRADWIGRIYQPIFFEMMIFISVLYAKSRESIKRLSSRFIKLFIYIVIFGNLLIVFGPSLRSELFAFPYWAFYKHSHSSYIYEHTENLGVTPLGICRKL